MIIQGFFDKLFDSIRCITANESCSTVKTTTIKLIAGMIEIAVKNNLALNWADCIQLVVKSLVKFNFKLDVSRFSKGCSKYKE